MFLGTYYLTFSGKGRLILPKKFRKELKKPEIILMKGIDQGIWGFSEQSWQEFVNTQLKTSITQERGRNIRRQFFPFSESVDLDKQGRFVISDFLLFLTKIKEKIVLIGVGDHFEIWDLKKWQTELKKLRAE